MKRLNPYTRLLNEVKAYVRKVKYRRIINMFVFSKKALEGNDAWNLNDVYQRTLAAGTLGYDVQLIADEKGMRINYIKKIPDDSFEWR